MKKAGLWLWILAVLISMPAAWAGDEYSWELKRDREGIQVSTRSVKGSPLLEFQSRTLIKVPVEKAAALYEDVDAMMEWFFKCKEAKLVQQVSAEESIVYFAADLPWPLADRDGVYRRVKTTDSATGAVVYKLRADNTLYPPQKGRVRVVYLDAEWRFTPQPDGSTEVYYRMHTDSGGYVPAKIVNRFTVSLPFKTLKKFRALLEA